MALTISILDETPSGESIATRSIQVEHEATTLRDLIRQRIQSELDLFEGLVQPEESERILNGYKLKERRKLDWQKQYEKAIRSFERNGFLVILDDRQISDLDEKLQLFPTSGVHFLKLT